MIGGLFGAAVRQAVEEALPPTGTSFPLATWLINVAGAALLGTLLGALGRDAAPGRRHQARLLCGTGFCGAFTTYSSLAMESVQLGRHGAPFLAGLYLGASLAAGLLAAAAGLRLGRACSR